MNGGADACAVIKSQPTMQDLSLARPATTKVRFGDRRGFAGEVTDYGMDRNRRISCMTLVPWFV